VQFVSNTQSVTQPQPQIPRTPTPQRDYESLAGLGRDSSFGSRSFLDLSLWNE
jgi:hypothetical protein